jgi:hypothetical protein
MSQAIRSQIRDIPQDQPSLPNHTENLFQIFTNVYIS